MPQALMSNKLKLTSSMKTCKTSRTNIKKKKKKVLFIIGDWNEKVESQELPGVTVKFGLGVQNEVKAKGNRVLSKEHNGHRKCPLSETQEMILHMDITR